jgi:hypothetical protein
VLIRHLHRGISQDPGVFVKLGDDLGIGFLESPPVLVGTPVTEEPYDIWPGMGAETIEVAYQEPVGEATHLPRQLLKGLDGPGTFIYLDHDRSHVGEDPVKNPEISSCHLDSGEWPP